MKKHIALSVVLGSLLVGCASPGRHHTYEYVIEMLVKLFQHSVETAFTMACEVDKAGRVVVDTTSKERAELKRDQIHAYGADWRLSRSQGSMSAEIEPAE